jgi:hypothetical protein
VKVRQICPRGQAALLVGQRQRPLVFDGCDAQLVVALTDSQTCPEAHGVEQPPQWLSLFEMLMATPPQQRSAAELPQR